MGKEKHLIKNKKQMFIVIGVFCLTLLLGTITYAFFNYTRTGSANVIKTGRISFNSEQGNSINLTNMFPIDVSEGIPNDATKVGSVTIHVTGDTTYTEGIEYLVTAVNVQNSVNNKTLPISIDVGYSANGNGKVIGTADNSYFTNRGGDSSVYKILANNTINSNDRIVVGYIKPDSTGIDGNIVIRAYLDKAKIAISDTYPEEDNDANNDGYLDGTTNTWVNDRTVFTTSEWNSLQANGVSFQIKVESNEGIWVEEPALKAYETVRLALSNMATQPTFVDNMGTQDDETDDITYLVGNNTEVDFNYVWYSGKLWRIVAINPDGTMKLITENLITSMIPGSKDFSTSYTKEWLNEDFYSTLVNANNIIVQGSAWNMDDGTATTSDSTPLRPRTDNDNYLVTAPVGLLNAFEYYNIYNNSSAVDNYLQIGFDWLTLTETDTIKIRYVYRNPNEKVFSSVSPSQDGVGIRPVIVLNNNVIFTGSGTKTNPYRIKGDKEDAIANTTLLNTRVSGEYVNFNNELYRIVGVDDNKTKIVRMDYIRNSASTETPKAVLTMKITSSNYYGSSINDNSDNYWDYYLNNTWYNSISNTYKSMIVDGTYYTGNIDYGTSYKQTMCKDDNLNNVTTSNCTRFTNLDANKTFTGKVGLLRYSEMFATEQKIDYDTIAYYLITPFGSNEITKVFKAGASGSSPTTMNTVTVRPAIYIDSNALITSGTGLIDSPYEITI